MERTNHTRRDQPFLKQCIQSDLRTIAGKMSTIQSNLHYVPQMFRLSAHFSGRELSCIQDGLHNNRVVVISGRAGTSKTQLELRCANSLLQDHQVVW